MTEQPLYFVEREYDVPVSRLWRAWVNPAELESWYSPTFLSVIPGSVTSESVVGGGWAVAVDVSANGFNAYFWGNYSSVIENQKLVHTMFYSQDELEFLARLTDGEHHRIEIDFESRGNRSWVRFSQFGEMDPEQADASREGMESYFDNLANHLAASAN